MGCFSGHDQASRPHHGPGSAERRPFDARLSDGHQEDQRHVHLLRVDALSGVPDHRTGRLRQDERNCSTFSSPAGDCWILCVKKRNKTLFFFYFFFFAFSAILAISTMPRWERLLTTTELTWCATWPILPDWSHLEFWAIRLSIAMLLPPLPTSRSEDPEDRWSFTERYYGRKRKRLDLAFFFFFRLH